MRFILITSLLFSFSCSDKLQYDLADRKSGDSLSDSDQNPTPGDGGSDNDIYPSIKSVDLFDIEQGEVTGLVDTRITVTGNALVSFKYKFTNDAKTCSDNSDYIDSSDMSPINVDLSSLADGAATACVMGLSTDGLITGYDDATTFSWVKDTKCGELSGVGSAENPFMIRNENDLRGIACLSHHYKLKNSIMMSSIEPASIIGSQPNPFTGSFDGDMKSITNIAIQSNSDYVGLFGYTDGAVIKNLSISGSTIQGEASYQGSLAGYAKDTNISNCSSSMNVEGLDKDLAVYIGGLVGYLEGGSISSSFSSGDVQGYTYTGGLVGIATKSAHIYQSYSKGWVSNFTGSSPPDAGDEVFVGGLVGSLSEDSLIEESFAVGKLVVTGSAVGGLVGAVTSNSRISKSFAVGDVETNGRKIGGLVGLLSGNELNSLPTIENSYSLGNIYSSDIEAASFVGVNIDSVITNSYSLGYTYAKIDENGASSSPAGFVNNIATLNSVDKAKVESSFFLKQGLNAFSTSNPNSLVIEASAIGRDDFNDILEFEDKGWDFTSVWMMDPLLKRPILRGASEDSHAYTEIKNANDLNNIRNSLKGYFVLTSDIDLSTYSSFNPIGDASVDARGRYVNAFRGRLDGASHKITNLKINEPSKDDIGLFGTTAGASFSNLEIEGPQISGKESVGTLIGFSLQATTIQSVSILEVNSSKVVSEGEAAGGIAGNFIGAIVDSQSGVDVEAKDTEAGGFFGIAGSKKDGSGSYLFMFKNITLNTSDITSSSRVGGGIGQLNIEFSKIENYVSNANVATITGSPDGTRVAGIIGYALVEKYLSIDQVYYVNDDQGIIGNGHIGGIIGKLEPPSPLEHVGNVLITRVHSAGVITKKTTNDGAIGGLLGRVMKLKNVTIKKSYSVMDIQSSDNDSSLEYVGGLFGKVGGSLLEFELEDSYFFGSIDLNENTRKFCGYIAGDVEGNDTTPPFRVRSFKNIYAAGSLNNCTTESDKTGLWGADTSSGIHNNAIPSSSYVNVFGYENSIDANHCSGSSSNAGDCGSEIGYTSDFNSQYPGDTVWEEGDCDLNSPLSQKQPVLISNPHDFVCKSIP